MTDLFPAVALPPRPPSPDVWAWAFIALILGIGGGLGGVPVTAPEPALPQNGGACGKLSEAIDVACLMFVLAIFRARTGEKK